MIGAAAVTAALLALPAANAGTAPMTISLGSGATFPARTLVLSAPAGVHVSVPEMYVWENGGPVNNLSVTPLANANAGDFGVVLVIDQSASMGGAPLARAMGAARALARQRTGKQELGVITFDSHPTTLLPLTSDPFAIGNALRPTPRTGNGTHILPALTLALKQLADANIADGAVILLSDGAATGSVGNLTPQSIATAARSQHVRIFTVGLRDRSSNPGALRRLARLGSGEFTAATGAQLSQIFTNIAASLTRSYVVRYRSIVSAGQQVAVKVHLNGVSAPALLSYYAPAASTSPAGSGAGSGSGSGSGSGTPSPSTSSPGTSNPGASKPGASKPGASQHKPGGTHGGAPYQASNSAPPLPSLPPGQWPRQHQPQRLTALPSFATPATGWQPAPPAPHSFWSSSLAALVVGGGCALLIAIAIAIVLFSRPDRRGLRIRVNSFLAVARAEPIDPASANEPSGLLGRFLARSQRWPAFVELVHTARKERSALALVKRWTAVSAVVAVVLVEVSGATILGLLVLLASPFLLKAWVGRGARKQRIAFSDQLPSNLQDLAGAMRAGRSLVGAIAAVAETAVEPVKGEFERAVTDERLGLPLEETIEAIGIRMEAKDMEQVALIAALHRSSGSNAAEALDRVAESARERADMIREMRALTGQARMSCWVLSGLPPAMLAALSVLAPSYSHPLFHTPAGIVLLVIGTGMVFSGWKVMNKITNPEG
jgi:Flp pilus assembly protein TadB/uncharacterized protein YegL